MIRFHAGLVVIYTRDLANEIGLLSFRIFDGGEGTRPLMGAPTTQQSIDKILSALLENPNEMPLPQPLRWKIERLQERVRTDEVTTLVQFDVLLTELLNDIISELSFPYFLMIPAHRREMYEQRVPPFGDQVADTFPAANYDIAAASRCLALDEWTACVFHLMRAAELALRTLARRLKIKKVEIKDWAQLLRDVDDALAAIRQKPRSASRDRRLQYYSHVRSSFAGFKDAWRNHVMHSHETYDERQALLTCGHVKALMEELARGP